VSISAVVSAVCGRPLCIRGSILSFYPISPQNFTVQLIKHSPPVCHKYSSYTYPVVSRKVIGTMSISRTTSGKSGVYGWRYTLHGFEWKVWSKVIAQGVSWQRMKIRLHSLKTLSRKSLLLLLFSVIIRSVFLAQQNPLSDALLTLFTHNLVMKHFNGKFRCCNSTFTYVHFTVLLAKNI